ncbi:hypothetical protein RYA05_01270 [Pseudomonas syringae pv. actinidiae]|nr:hypothetical protein [Pseudomonas syringae pv. actinidiae]
MSNETTNHPELRWKMFTTLSSNGVMLAAFHGEFQITFFSSSTPVKVIVETTNDEDKATHWGWLVDKTISMVQPSLLQLDMCFPGDPAAREQAGEGRRTPLIATPTDW